MGGGTQVRVRASTGWFVVVEIFGWGRGGGGGWLRAGPRGQLYFLLTPRSRARATGREAEELFFHTHTPDCSFPVLLPAPSSANSLCQAGAAAEAARAQLSKTPSDRRQLCGEGGRRRRAGLPPLSLLCPLSPSRPPPRCSSSGCSPSRCFSSSSSAPAAAGASVREGSNAKESLREG